MRRLYSFSAHGPKEQLNPYFLAALKSRDVAEEKLKVAH